jgi:hypothetical protein
MIERQARVAAADAIHFSIEHALRRLARFEDREADARRTPIDGQDIGHRFVTFA